MLACTARVGPHGGERDQDGRDDVAGRLELGQAQPVQPPVADEQRAVHGEDEQRSRNPHPGRAAHHDQDEQPGRAQDGQVNAARARRAAGAPARPRPPRRPRSRWPPPSRRRQTARAHPGHQPRGGAEDREPDRDRHGRLTVVVRGWPAPGSARSAAGSPPSCRPCASARSRRCRAPPACRLTTTRLSTARLRRTSGRAAGSGRGIAPAPGQDTLHHGALPGRRPYRCLPAAVGGALGDGPPEAEPALIDAGRVEPDAAGRARSPAGGRALGIPGCAIRRTCTQASPVPACAATLDSASRVAFEIAVATRAGMAGTPSSSISRWTLSPRPRMSATTARTSADQVAGRAPGARGQVTGVAQRALDQGHVPPAPAHHPGHVIAAGSSQRGERVEHRVVQQALVLAAFDVPGQDGVLLAGGPVGFVPRRRPPPRRGRRAGAGRRCGEPDDDQQDRGPCQRPRVRTGCSAAPTQ